MTDLQPAAAGALRVRRLPPRSGGGRSRRRRGPRHPRPDADGLGQVAHLPARRDAAAGADARPLPAHRADEGPGRPAAARDRRDGDVRQLVPRSARRRRAGFASVAEGRTRILYAAPERLRNAAFVETLRAIGVGLVVIDEVHCVSMWGHDFRPDYLFIRRALEALGDPSVLGMTATATPAAARRDRRRRSAVTSQSCGRASSGRTCATTSRRSAATRIASASSSSG